MAQLFETVCMSLVFNKSHSLAMHYCRLVWDVRSLSHILFYCNQRDFNSKFIQIYFVFDIKTV